MKLKNKIIIYSWTGKKVNYLNPRKTTTHVFARIKYEDNTCSDIPIPNFAETPRDIEMYCKGIETVIAGKFEREDVIC